MKKLLFLLQILFLFISGTTSLTSCSSDNDELSTDKYSEAILGTWKVVESCRDRPVYDNKTGVTMLIPDSDFANGSTFKFTPSKVYRDCRAYNSGICEYELWKDRLNVGFGGAIFTIQIKGNTMTWDGDVEYDKNVHLVLNKTAEFEM